MSEIQNLRERCERLESKQETCERKLRVSDKPDVVCICGSTRFADEHAIVRWELEKKGKYICLMINYLPECYVEEQGWDGLSHHGEASGHKEALDELHLRKIDLADWVLVINPNDYIGNSTSKEIAYARKHGKSVKFLYEHNEEAEDARDSE